MTLDPNLVVRQKVDFTQINKILKKANVDISSAEEVTAPDAKFELAYSAMLKTAQALMRSYGFRTKSDRGHHRVLVDFAKKELGARFAGITAAYGRMRKTRNGLEYDIDSVSATEARAAIGIAKKFFDAVEQKISEENPQQKLWRPAGK